MRNLDSSHLGQCRIRVCVCYLPHFWQSNDLFKTRIFPARKNQRMDSCKMARHNLSYLKMFKKCHGGISIVAAFSVLFAGLIHIDFAFVTHARHNNCH